MWSAALGVFSIRRAVSSWRANSVALCLALLACAPAAPGPAPAPVAHESLSLEQLRAQRVEMAAAFAAQAAMCSARQDTAHAAFHGCVDWHSAAHAAWALSAYARLTGDRRYEAQLDAQLTSAAVAAERDYLRARPAFEMPYGRAWFLRLAAERRVAGDGRLDAMAEDVARSLEARYAEWPPDPRAERYDSDAWALINLLHYARVTQDAAREGRVRALVERHFTAPDARCDLALEQRGFIAVCTTWAWLVAEALPAEAFRAWYARWNPGLETLTPVTEYAQAHEYGRNFSRAWGLPKLAEASGDARLRESYARHVSEGYAPASRWRGEYMTNGHWVAQFGMLAIAPLFPAPATP